MELLERVGQGIAAGVLPLLVLAIIGRDGPIHGYRILKQLEHDMGRPLGKEGTIYPLLADLQRRGLLESAWGPATHGPRRKEYVLTIQGHRELAASSRAWDALRGRIDQVLKARETE